MFNHLMSGGYFVFPHVLHSKVVHCAHRLHVCVSYSSQSKLPLFPYIALTDSFL